MQQLTTSRFYNAKNTRYRIKPEQQAHKPRLVKNYKVTSSYLKQESVRPRWPYDMLPSARAEKYMCVIVIR